MEEKKFILVKNYLQIRAFHDLEVYCQEGRKVELKVYSYEKEELNKYGEVFLLTRKDFLYSHSDTSITMCHLTFKGENLEGLEFEELDFFNLLSKIEYREHKIECIEYKEQNEKDKEEIRENHTKLKEDFEAHKEEFETHKKEFETHKEENKKDFEENEKEHEEFRKLGGGIKEVLWNDLKTLRDTSKLSTGTWYRITDYNCYLNSSITTIQSGGHQFDILLFATEKNKLNENALAIAHKDDTYFQYCNLEAWKLKYSLDNDQSKFVWCASDDEGGKGVIWWMCDEYGNECYYDFKNLKEARYEITADASGRFYDFTQCRFFTSQTSIVNSTVDTSTQYYFYTFSTWLTFDGEIKDLSVMDFANTPTMFRNKDYFAWGNNKILDNSFLNGKTTGTTDLFGINCFIMADKDYETDKSDFGFYQFRFTNNILKFGSNGNTFNLAHSFGNGWTIDDETHSKGVIVESMDNKFESLCHSNTFSSYCYSNTFGSLCYSNTFGSSCYFNTFGSLCYSNTFSYDCYSNTFGSYCSSNTFGSHCSFNTFGSSCSFNTFGYNCSFNTFGYDCYSNTLNTNNTSSYACKYLFFGPHVAGKALNGITQTQYWS